MVTLREYLWKNRFDVRAYELAQKVDISKEYLSAIVNGRYIPSVALAKAIQEATNGDVRWHELIDWCTEMKKQASQIDDNQDKVKIRLF